MSDSDDSRITSNSLYIALDYSLRIQDITGYYRKAAEQLFDDTGNANDPAPEAVAGSLRLDNVRSMVLQHCNEGQEAMLSYPWGRVESAQKEFREVTERFEVKLEQVKALDSRWDEMDADEIRGSASDSELISMLSRLLAGRSTIPIIPSVTIPELPTRSSLESGVTPLEMFEYAKLESPKSTIRLVRMESISAHPEAPMRITTRTISLQDKVPYATLSYTWGNPFGLFCSEKDRDAVPRTDVPIICNGKRLEIGENLYRFLWRWRKRLVTHDDIIWNFRLSDKMEEYLRPLVEIWIDAICINQEDLEERNQQVSIMGDIYTKSAATWVWLGEDDEFSQVAFTILEKMSTLYDLFDGADFESVDELEKDETLDSLGLPDSNSWGWFAVFALFQRQWFRRSWIVQEATLSSRLLFQCGSAVMSGGFIFSALGGLRRFKFVGEMIQILGREEMKRKLADRPSRNRAGLERSIKGPSDSRYHLCRDGMASEFAGYLSQVIRIKSLDPEILANDRNGLNPNKSENEDKVPELLNLWKTSQNTLCSNLRDKVYAFASLVHSDIYKTPSTVQDRRALQPDYKKSVCEVYCEAAWFTLLTHASLDVLSMAGHMSLNSNHDLPSWVPDLSQSPRFLSLNNYLFSLNNYLQCYPGLGWLASGGARWEIPPPAKRHGRHLGVRVSVVGRIKDTEYPEPENTSEEWSHARFRHFLEFSTLLPSTYLSHPDGQSRFEVVWRTIIADAIDGISPASPKYAADFEKFCKEAIEYVLDGIAAGNDDTDLSRTTAAVRDMQRLQDLLASFSQMDIEADEDRNFWYRTFEAMQTRRLFIADTGYVGCGESGLSIGDLIVIVAGSSIPLILRHSSSGRYILIGDAYVHGIMFGEHAMKPGVEWESITLE